MHSKCQATWDSINFYLTIPSIVMSTLVGSATIGLPSIVTDPNASKWVTTGLGVLTLSTGIMTSVNQFMKSSQMSEANRAAMVSYGKLHRIVSTELALRRDQRIDAQAFLKTVRAELDRLQDTSPAILEEIISKFRTEFKDNAELEKPEIAGDLEHVQVNRSSKNGVGFSVPSTPGPQKNSILMARAVSFGENFNLDDEKLEPLTQLSAINVPQNAD